MVFYYGILSQLPNNTQWRGRREKIVAGTMVVAEEMKMDIGDIFKKHN